MRLFISFLLLSILLALISCTEKDTMVQPDTTEPDVTEPDTTAPILWTREQSPITITKKFAVEEYDSLIIEPGVTVQFGPGVSLIVKGTLLCLGTPSDSILLTSADGEYWGGIHFLDSADASRMEYTAATYCWEQVLMIENTSPVISHCRLQYSDSFSSLRLSCIIGCTGTASPLIEHCLILGYVGDGGCGVSCFSPANPHLVHNDIVGTSSQSCVRWGGFLDGNYLAVWRWNGSEWIVAFDKSLGSPVDEIGDGVCTTTSTDPLCLFSEVDGVTDPQGLPHYIFW